MRSSGANRRASEMLMREHAWVGFRYGQLFGLAAGPLAGSAG